MEEKCIYCFSIKILSYFLVSISTKPALLAEAIYTNSAHYCLFEPDKMNKEIPPITGAVVLRVRRVAFAFDVTDASSNPTITKLILLPFPITNQLRVAFIVNKKLRKYSKSENKVPNVYLIVGINV